MKKLARHVGNIVMWVLTIGFAVVLIGNLWMMFQSTVQQSKAPSILGYSPLIVNTGSMAGDKADDFNAGDLVIIHKTKKTLNLKKGTIITFVDPHSESKALVTHRINRVVTHGEDHVYETKGDANNTSDKGVINPSQIVGVYQTHLKGFGSKLMFLQSPKGMLLFIVLPLILLFGSDYIMQAFKPKASKHESGVVTNSITD
ncbi:S26 family signal peptidase [Bacilli bacterium]|nr:S26 family signal peptidase [Bacilli bacterium]GHU43885.1 S26 family signal peptidase [Bacilli bacterium]